MRAHKVTHSLDEPSEAKASSVPKMSPVAKVSAKISRVKTPSNGKIPSLTKVLKKNAHVRFMRKKKKNAVTKSNDSAESETLNGETDEILTNTPHPSTQPNQASVSTARVSVAPRGEWRNRTRVLVFSSRGIDYHGRHLMIDLRHIMPHSKSDSKMDRKSGIPEITEIAQMRNCDKVMYFEARRKAHLYLWLGNVKTGPTGLFLLENIHTMDELKLTGNSLKGSRPILSFEPFFDAHPAFGLIKELLTQIFSTPRYHPKSQPFVDRILNFAHSDSRIWFRNYQIVNQDDGSLAEIGPRFVLNPIKIFEGSFGGKVIWENPLFESPDQVRKIANSLKGSKYESRVLNKKATKQKKAKKGTLVNYDFDVDNVFKESVLSMKNIQQ